MSRRNLVLVLLALFGLIVLTFMLMPSGYGITTQLQRLANMAVTAVVFVIGLILWFAEAVVLFVGAGILGVHWKSKALPLLDAKIDERMRMSEGQQALVTFLVSLAVAFLWLRVALFSITVWPLSIQWVGPWIQGYAESSLFWWAVAAFVEFWIGVGIAQFDWNSF